MPSYNPGAKGILQYSNFRWFLYQRTLEKVKTVPVVLVQLSGIQDKKQIKS